MSFGQRLRRFVVNGAALLLTFLLAATVARTADLFTGAPSALRTGVASVVRCTGHGPVSGWGFGFSYACTADVRWRDGERERREFFPGQLSPGERDVPVFQSSSGRQVAPSPGRNDRATFFASGMTAAVVLILLLLWFALATLGAALALVRPDKSSRPEQQAKEPSRGGPAETSTAWPVSRADIAAVRLPRIAVRLRLSLVTLAFAAVCAVLGSIPYYDAPRRLNAFRTPWPQIERAWLTGLPLSVFLVLTALIGGVLLLAGTGIRRDAARVVRYGERYLVRRERSSKAAHASWRLARAARQSERLRSRLVGVLLTAIGVVALVEALLEVVGTPILVWVGGLRDALVFLGIGVVWLCTVETRADRFDRLLGQQMTSADESSGTDRRLTQS